MGKIMHGIGTCQNFQAKEDKPASLKILAINNMACSKRRKVSTGIMKRVISISILKYFYKLHRVKLHTHTQTDTHISRNGDFKFAADSGSPNALKNGPLHQKGPGDKWLAIV
jgi:hypothetical protein